MSDIHSDGIKSRCDGLRIQVLQASIRLAGAEDVRFDGERDAGVRYSQAGTQLALNPVLQ